MKKSKGMMAGGKMKSKGYAGGGKMKSKGYAGGGKMKAKGYAGGGKMPMSKDPRTGQMVPSFTIDGKGRMMGGGKTMNMMTKDGVKMSPKMMANGGMTKIQKMEGGGMAKGFGAARNRNSGNNK